MVTETRLDQGVLLSINTCTKQMVEDVWYSAVRCWRRAWQGSWFVTDRWNIAQRWSRTCHNPYRCSRQWLWRRDWTSIFPRILDAGMNQWSFVLMRLLADLEGILLFGNIALQSTVTQYATRQRMLNCNLLEKKLLHAFILKLKGIILKLL